MGQRAFTDEATEDDLKAMVHHTKESIAAGAIGFSTTRSVNHMTSDDKPVASRLATWDEFETLVKAMGAGMVEVAGEPRGADATRRGATTRAWRSSRSRAAGRSPSACSTGAPSRAHWRTTFDIIERTARQGGRMFAQVHSRALNVLLSFETQLPFDKWDMWREMRKLPLGGAEEVAARSPTCAAGWSRSPRKPYEGPMVRGAEARPPEWDCDLRARPT